MFNRTRQPVSRQPGAILLPGLLVTVALLGLARGYDTFPGDQWALLELRQMRTGWLDDACVFVSEVGRAGIGWGVPVPWIPLLAVAMLASLRRWTDAGFLAAATLAPVINLGLKALADRPRPDADLWLVMESGNGFPSGHAVFAAAFLGALAWLVGRWTPLDGRPGLRLATQGALLMLVLAVGFSRVYLGVHWPSDVIAGFLFGGTYLCLLIAARRAMEIRQKGSREFTK